jgi:hypothetical protein
MSYQLSTVWVMAQSWTGLDDINIILYINIVVLPLIYECSVMCGVHGVCVMDNLGKAYTRK